MLNKIIIFVILVGFLLFTLPETTIGKLPYVLNIKLFIEHNFEVGVDKTKTQIQNTTKRIQNIFVRVKNKIIDTFNSTKLFINEKIQAVKDLTDALNRLTNWGSSTQE